ncbi:MAG TPA: alpha/beta hydrolase-fold protein [Acidimicrobiales bacterium]
MSVSKGRHRSSRVSRRTMLAWLAGAIGVVAAAGVTGFELVDHGVLPGKQVLDELDGGCDVTSTALSFASLGPSLSAQFNSKARNRSVGYTIAYPPGHHVGDELPLVVMLHGYDNNHRTAFFGMSPAQAVALTRHGARMNPVALVTVDGGNGYWNPHPGDDPQAMVVDELIPLCQGRGLGRGANGIRMMGISMGGYGALAIAERHEGLVSSVAAISPAIWTSYDQARAANPEAFASKKAFDDGNVITHASRLSSVAVRVASGVDDPFHPGVVTLAKALPTASQVVFSSGCHTEPFFIEQEPPSLRFMSLVDVHG